jgi:hypothetical protein
VVRGDGAYHGFERSSAATIEDIFVGIVNRTLGIQPVSTAGYSIKATAPIKLIGNGGMPMLSPWMNTLFTCNALYGSHITKKVQVLLLRVSSLWPPFAHLPPSSSEIFLPATLSSDWLVEQDP